MFALTLLALLALCAQHAHAQQEEGEAYQMGRARALEGALQEVLSEQGLAEEEVDHILYLLGARPLRPSGINKRMGWKQIQIPIQTRFAAFGTKLVPSRNHGDSSGPNLLRYGRSV